MTTAEELKSWFSREVLEGQDVGLDEETQLIELGLIDSITTIKLQTFVASRFGVEIPLKQLTAENLGSIRAITSMIERLQKP